MSAEVLTGRQSAARKASAAVTAARWAERIDAAGGALLRYGVVAILLYFGAFKFHPVEAEAIRPLVANSPAMGWLYQVARVQAVSSLIGVVEIAAALLIALRPLSPKLSLVGSVLAAGTFAATLSFLFTTPGVWASVPGFPLPVPNETGAFLLKDVFLLGAALWSAAESLRAMGARE